MAFKTKTVIGLEVAYSKVKLVEIVSSPKGVKITNFSIFDYPSDLEDGGTLQRVPTHERIKDAIRKAALNTKEIYGVVSSPLVEHRIVLLPPMTEKEMLAVTRREASKVHHGESALGMSGETSLLDVSFGFDVVGRIDIGDIKKTAVLIVTAPYELVREQVRTLEDLGICLRGLTIVPLALFHALLQSKACSEEDTIAFIYVGIKSTCIIMVSNNSLLFSREFSLTSGAEVTEANCTERLTVEVKRSFLYFKQRYRGKEVSKGILSGDMQELKTNAALSGMDLRNLADLLAKELDVGIEVFGVPEKLEISLPRERLSEFQSLLPSLTIPIGLAIAGLRQSGVNLLSQEGIRGKGLWRTDTVLRIASGILLLMLLGSYTWVSMSKFYTQRARLDTLKALESLRPELKNISTFEGERHEHAARLLLIERLNTPSTPEEDWAELLREISWLVPDDIVFNTLDARQEKGQRRRIIIEGKARTKGRFNEFLSYLQNSSSLSVLSSHQRINTIPSQSKADGLYFVIECGL
ncbi:MAG: PilN domain-containing protein [Candidatus Brocadiales bacterium]